MLPVPTPRRADVVTPALMKLELVIPARNCASVDTPDTASCSEIMSVKIPTLMVAIPEMTRF